MSLERDNMTSEKVASLQADYLKALDEWEQQTNVREEKIRIIEEERNAHKFRALLRATDENSLKKINERFTHVAATKVLDLSSIMNWGKIGLVVDSVVQMIKSTSSEIQVLNLANNGLGFGEDSTDQSGADEKPTHSSLKKIFDAVRDKNVHTIILDDNYLYTVFKKRADLRKSWREHYNKIIEVLKDLPETVKTISFKGNKLNATDIGVLLSNLPSRDPLPLVVDLAGNCLNAPNFTINCFMAPLTGFLGQELVLISPAIPDVRGNNGLYRKYGINYNQQQTLVASCDWLLSHRKHTLIFDEELHDFLKVRKVQADYVAAQSKLEQQSKVLEEARAKENMRNAKSINQMFLPVSADKSGASSKAKVVNEADVIDHHLSHAPPGGLLAPGM